MILPPASLFPDDAVITLELRVAAGDQRARLEDLEQRLGERGGGVWELAASRAQDALTAPAEARIAGETRTDATVRYAGHASLCGPWAAGRLKLPMHIELPSPIDGFHALHLVPGYRDPSLIREKLALELLHHAGVPALRATLCRVQLDHGDGTLYGGLYTAVESPTARFERERFGSSGGKLFEAIGDGSEWRTTEPTGYIQRRGPTNGEPKELRAAMQALHAPTHDREAWRAALEARLDVDGFLRWLAVNFLLHNTDTYGHKSHNFWFWADPAREDRLSFVPCDLANAFTQRGPKLRPLFDRRSERWPLIGKLLDDPLYRDAYLEHLQHTLDEHFRSARLQARIEELADLTEAHVVGPTGERAPHTLLERPEAFREEVAELHAWVVRRERRVREGIASSK